MLTATLLQDALRSYITRPDSPRVGPYVLTLDSGGHPGRNYAIPEAGAEPTAEDVRRLAEAFRSRGLLPRLEMVVPSAALDALLQGGFTVEQRLPLLTASTLAPAVVAGTVELLLAVSDDDLRTCAEVQDLSYGDVLDPDNPGRLRRTVDHGGHVVLALDGGVPAGSGLCTEPVVVGDLAVAEIAAIGTLAPHRRQGIAAGICALLASTLLEEGTAPYLQAEGDSERGIYERLGFRTIGELAVVTAPR